VEKRKQQMNKIIKKLSGDLFIVVMLGLVSTTTAWTAIQSSLHGGRSSDAGSEYQLILSEANNMWITAEVKYRDDLSVWKDKQVRVLVDGVSMDDIYSDIKTANGSYELYVFAMPCFYENPKGFLPGCKAYMDELYNPYTETHKSSEYWTNLSDTEGKYSNQLQMLTGLFAVSLFLLGITTVMKMKNLVAYLSTFSVLIWLFGAVVLSTIPTVFS
jgi:hypothetical protein